MTGKSSLPRLAMAWSAGKIFLYARSPVAPNTTSASERGRCVCFIVPASLPGSLLFDMSAKTEAHGGQHLVLEQIEVARGEALEQRGRQDVRRHAEVVGRGDRPAPLAGVGHLAAELRKLG